MAAAANCTSVVRLPVADAAPLARRSESSLRVTWLTAKPRPPPRYGVHGEPVRKS